MSYSSLYITIVIVLSFFFLFHFSFISLYLFLKKIFPFDNSRLNQRNYTQSSFSKQHVCALREMFACITDFFSITSLYAPLLYAIVYIIYICI